MQLRQHPLPSPTPGTQRELVSLHYGRPGEGQKVYIQASLHADELPGMLTAWHLRRQFDALEAAGRLRGEIVLVPMANPIGLSQWWLQSHLGRFEGLSGENVNRHYPEHIEAAARHAEPRLGADAAHNVAVLRAALRTEIQAGSADTELKALRKTLMLLACDADVVLDLHCDAQAMMHLYTETPCWPQCEPLAAYLGAAVTLLATGEVWDGLRRLKKERQSSDICVIGDIVEIKQVSPTTGAVEAVAPRRSKLARRAPGSKGVWSEDVMVANVDQVLLVFACAHPDFHPRMLDRYLVLAEASELETVIVANKVDLVGDVRARELFAEYERIFASAFGSPSRRPSTLQRLASFGRSSAEIGVRP